MPVPKIKDVIEQKRLEATKDLIAEKTLAVDDEYTSLINEAQEGNRDTLAIITALVMLAPVLSIAITLFNLSIDRDILRIMYSMIAGQFITNTIVVYVMHKQFYTAIRRNTKYVYMHFNNRDSVKRIRELEQQLQFPKRPEQSNNEKA